MQEILKSPTQIVPKQASINYWPGFVLHGLATFFLDEDQLNAIKLAFAMILPVVVVHARVRVSEISSINSMVAKTVNSSFSCSQACRS
jgi:hypothetical protein